MDDPIRTRLDSQAFPNGGAWFAALLAVLVALYALAIYLDA